MPTSTTTISPEQRRTRLSSNSQSVLKELEQLHASLQVGDAFPSYRQLMKSLGASERAVVWALDELEKQGKIVRRLGRGGAIVAAGKAVTQRESDTEVGRDGNLPTALKVATRTIIACAIPDHALFDQAMKLLVEQTKNEDISVLCHLLSGASSDLSLLPQVAHEPLGYIVFRRDLLPLAEKIQAAGHRVIALATPSVDTTPAVPVVYGDQEYGGYLATKHLIDLGHRRIAFCAYEDYPQMLRWRGHQRALREAARQGMEIQDSMLDLLEIETWKDAPAKGEAVFHSDFAPTGLVVWNDHEAVKVIGHLNRLGLRVPEDVSIVGYDNLREGQMMHPALTTVHSPIEQQLQVALNLLTREKAIEAPYQVVIQPTLVHRNSSVPLAP